MTRLLLAATASVALAACSQQPPAVPEAPPPPVFAPGECDGQAALFALGQPYTDALRDKARDASRAERVRVIRPGEMVTMDFDARRLTLVVDDTGRVERARCG